MSYQLSNKHTLSVSPKIHFKFYDLKSQGYSDGDPLLSVDNLGTLGGQLTALSHDAEQYGTPQVFEDTFQHKPDETYMFIPRMSIMSFDMPVEEQTMEIGTLVYVPRGGGWKESTTHRAESNLGHANGFICGFRNNDTTYKTNMIKSTQDDTGGVGFHRNNSSQYEYVYIYNINTNMTRQSCHDNRTYLNHTHGHAFRRPMVNSAHILEYNSTLNSDTYYNARWHASAAYTKTDSFHRDYNISEAYKWSNFTLAASNKPTLTESDKTNYRFLQLGGRRYTDRAGGRAYAEKFREFIYFSEVLTISDREVLWDYLRLTHNCENDACLRDDQDKVNLVEIPAGEGLIFPSASGHSLGVGQKAGELYEHDAICWELWYRHRNWFKHDGVVPYGDWNSYGRYNNNGDVVDLIDADSSNPWPNDQTTMYIPHIYIKNLVWTTAGLPETTTYYVNRPIMSWSTCRYQGSHQANSNGIYHVFSESRWKHLKITVNNLNDLVNTGKCRFITSENGMNDLSVSTSPANVNPTSITIGISPDQLNTWITNATNWNTEQDPMNKTPYFGMKNDGTLDSTVLPDIELAAFRTTTRPYTGDYVHTFDASWPLHTPSQIITNYDTYTTNTNNVFDATTPHPITGLTRVETNQLPLSAEELREWYMYTPFYSAGLGRVQHIKEWSTGSTDGYKLPKSEIGLMRDAVAQLTPVDIPPFLGEYPQVINPWAGSYYLNNTLATNLDHFALPGWKTSFKNTHLYLNSNRLNDITGLRPLYGMTPGPGDDIPTTAKHLYLHYNTLTNLDDIEGSTFQSNAMVNTCYLTYNPLTQIDALGGVKSVATLYIQAGVPAIDFTGYLKRKTYGTNNQMDVVSDFTENVYGNLPTDAGNTNGTEQLNFNTTTGRMTTLNKIQCSPVDFETINQTTTTVPVQGLYSFVGAMDRVDSWDFTADCITKLHVYVRGSAGTADLPTNFGTKHPNLTDVYLYQCNIISLAPFGDMTRNYGKEHSLYESTTFSSNNPNNIPWKNVASFNQLRMIWHWPSEGGLKDDRSNRKTSTARQQSMTNMYNAGKRIHITKTLGIPEFPLTDLRVFETSIGVANLYLTRTNIPDTANGLGVVESISTAGNGYLYLDECNLTTLDHLYPAIPSDETQTRETYYNKLGSYRWVHLENNNISNLGFIDRPGFAGCYFLYLHGNPIPVSQLQSALTVIKNRYAEGTLRLEQLWMSNTGVSDGMTGMDIRDWNITGKLPPTPTYKPYFGDPACHFRTDDNQGLELTPLGQQLRDLWSDTNNKCRVYGLPVQSQNNLAGCTTDTYYLRNYDPTTTRPGGMNNGYFPIRFGWDDDNYNGRIVETTTTKSANNTLTCYLMFNQWAFQGFKFYVYGFSNKTGQPSGNITLGGTLASIFGGTGSWDANSGTLTCTVATGKKISMHDKHTLSFTLKNGTTNVSNSYGTRVTYSMSDNFTGTAAQQSRGSTTATNDVMLLTD